MIQVAIVARSPALRRELRDLIESDGIRVVGEDVGVAINRSSDQRQPDVLIVAGPEGLPERVDPGTAIVAVADDKELPRRLVRMRATGWAIVLPGVSAEILRAAVTASAQGMVMLPASTLDAELSDTRKVDEAADYAERDEDELSLNEALTCREQEILELVALGLTNREVAGRLGISDHTVKFHLSTIYGKLGASTRTEAVRRAFNRGLVTL